MIALFYEIHKIVHWLDISHVFLSNDGKLNCELIPDGLHPNEEGFRAWTNAMEPTIKKFLGEK